MPLKAAVSGARQVETWLKAEGFDVTCLTDEGDRSVHVKDVKNAIKKYVDLGTLEQLLLYFAGHGQLNGFDELWLLSDAPDDPDEAINQTSSGDFARFCDVASVVFISDACRSKPLSSQAERVSGLSVFPNPQRYGQIHVKVDRFFAARPGDPALELFVDEARQTYAGLFTNALRKAHRDPDPGITRTIRINGSDIIVVPCRRLQGVLPGLVNNAAQQRSIALKQEPEIRLECGEEAFIAHAEFTPLWGTDSPTSPPPLIGRNSSLRSYRPLGEGPSGDLATNRQRSTSPAFLEAVAQVRRADSAARDSEMQAGIQVTGAEVRWTCASGPWAETELLTGFNHDSFRILLRGKGTTDPLVKPVSVLVEFGGGTGTVLAGLPGYVAAVAVDGDRVVNISYIPSRNAPFWMEYSITRELSDSLRAESAAAARNGLLVIDPDSVRQFEDKIRMVKRFDPTLGLYAALAYANFGLTKEAQSLLEWGIRDVRAALFDVALFARNIQGYVGVNGWPIVPFCPMLSQSWSFLQSRGVELLQPLPQAGQHRLAALWTTFDREGMRLLRSHAEKGGET
jgi:hypothetical protein